MFSHSREGNGPGFLIASCYRYYGHGRKDPSPYRSREEEASWKEKDPLEAQKRRLVAEGLLDEKAAEAMTAEVAKEMDAAVAWAAAGHVPQPEELFMDVYAEEGAV